MAGATYSAVRQAEKGKALLAKAVNITNKSKKGKKIKFTLKDHTEKLKSPRTINQP